MEDTLLERAIASAAEARVLADQAHKRISELGERVGKEMLEVGRELGAIRSSQDTDRAANSKAFTGVRIDIAKITTKVALAAAMASLIGGGAIAVLIALLTKSP